LRWATGENGLGALCFVLGLAFGLVAMGVYDREIADRYNHTKLGQIPVMIDKFNGETFLFSAATGGWIKHNPPGK
jgi:hypothetical protein